MGLSVVGFVGLIVPSMCVYPGGTVWDPTTRGSDFWLNYLSDLQRSVALNGEPNAGGAALAQAAMLVLAAGLAPLWWIVTLLLPGRRRLRTAIRLFGGAGVLGSIAAALLPSDRFGDGHALATGLGGLSGLAAAALAVTGLVLRGRPVRAAAVSGAATLATAAVDFALYVKGLREGGPDLMAIALLERMSVILLLSWMCVVGWQAVLCGEDRRSPKDGSGPARRVLRGPS